MTFVSVCMLQRSVTHDPFIPCHMSFLCLVAYYEANVILSSLIPCLKFFFYFNVFFHAAKLNFLKWNLDSINPVLQFSWALPSATLIVSHSTWHSALLPGHVSQSSALSFPLKSTQNTCHSSALLLHQPLEVAFFSLKGICFSISPCWNIHLMGQLRCSTVWKALHQARDSHYCVLSCLWGHLS